MTDRTGAVSSHAQSNECLSPRPFSARRSTVGEVDDERRQSFVRFHVSLPLWER